MEDRVLIEEYRGFDIYFDKSKEIFTCISGEYDIQKNKNTLTLAKKEIDAYIKESLNFTPIWVEKEDGFWRKEKRCVQLVGIRKDGRFVFENKNGEKEQLSEWDEKEQLSEWDEKEQLSEWDEKEQLSEWDEKDYWIKSPSNIPIFERISEIDNDIAMLQAERRTKERES